MDTNSDNIFYSLDIETSGFDPETSEILEVGFAAFEIKDSRFKIKEQWTKVFQPKAAVHPRILGLTGIRQKELDEGAEFNEYRNFLQEKLGGVTIVGHNIGFDIKFLEKYGIVFSGQALDTMSLVQFLLPTHHSYNLENLMHLFEVPHKEAHRALADAKATVKLLEKLVGVYCKLPNDTREQIKKISAQINAPWLNLFSIPTRLASRAKRAEARYQNSSASRSEGSIKPSRTDSSTRSGKNQGSLGMVKGLAHRTVYLTPPFTDPIIMAEQVIGQTDEKLLVVVPGRHQVLELWKRGAARGVFSSRFLFDKEKFEVLLKQGPQSLDQAIFFLKLVVWQATNWQHDSLLDLNLSFAGGQFKESVTGSELPSGMQNPVLCCDQQTFLELQGHPLFKGRALSVIGLAEFERAITFTIGEKSSWGYVSFLLKGFYDPTTETGDLKFKEIIVQALADTDLFFGLTVGLMEKLKRGLGEVAVNENVRNSLEFVRVAQAAEHYCNRLTAVNAILHSKEITDFCRQLKNFFVDQPHFVKWIDIGERTCSFHSLPLEIKHLVENAQAGFTKVCFVETKMHQLVLDYFKRRLGLENFAVSVPAVHSPSWLEKITKYFFPSQPVCLLMGDLNLTETFSKQKNLPAAVVLETAAEVSEIYRVHYQKLKKRAFVLAEQTGGGINKMFRNFSIHSNSLLLVSGKAVLNFLRASQQVRPISRLGVKVVAINEPLLPKKHDLYTQALAAQYQNPEKELFLPRALHDMHSILQFFHSKKLKYVLLTVPGKTFKYRQVLQEFLGVFYAVKEKK